MGALIGLAVLFLVIISVCSKLAEKKTAHNDPNIQQLLQTAYQQGFTDGLNAKNRDLQRLR